MFRRPLLLAFVAGLVSATGFAPLDWFGATLLCVAILLGLVWAAPTLKAALLRGWVFGVGHFTIGNNWIQHAFDFQDKMPPVLGYFAVVALALYLAVYPALAMGLAWRFARSVRDPARADLGYVLAAGAAWTLSEWLRGTMFTGYPWNPLGVIWLPVPGIAQLAAWIGTYALSGITVALAGTLLLAARREWRPLAASAAALVALAIFAMPVRLDKADGRPHVRVVQPNIGQDLTDDPNHADHAFAKLLEWSGQPGPVPRLIVWPEGKVDYYVEDGYPDRRFYDRGDPRWVRARIAATLGPRDIALIGGTALFFDGRGQLAAAGNSVWALDSAGMLGPRYDKAHLVPYGEYLPMRSLLSPLGFARLVMGDIDFRSGPGPRSIPAGLFGDAGVQICYEIIFSGQVVDRDHRPAFLFNPSNDAWFGRWGPPQHLAQARLRAIEEGLPVLRSTPNGISAVIDAHGQVIESIPRFQQGAIEVPLPAALPPTPFARLGNWMVLLVAGLLLAMAIAFRRLAR